MADKTLTRLCKEKGITIAQLEKELGYGNGSLGKGEVGNMSSMRIYEIAQYFGITMEQIIAPDKKSKDKETEADKLARKNRILLEMQEVNELISTLYRQILTLQTRLDALQKEYHTIDSDAPASD